MLADLQRALRRLKNNRSSGNDETPAEFWKVCLRSDALLTWLLQFCNMVWESRQIPDDWHLARVACLFKKGDPACPDNYRPISLLQVGYKLFSGMVLRRLQCAGVEEKIWKTQFGFRSGCGTRDAVFIARRMIEQCHRNKNQSMVFLALDWAKAFDSIDPICLVQALRRFGLPEAFLSIIRNIYTDRKFVVVDHGHKSELHSQHISKG